jgi:hypothetical protein
MKIPYKKKRGLISLILAILWGIYAGNGLTKESTNTFEYIALLCAVSYFLYFIFDKKIYYLTMRDGIIKTRFFFGKKIPLSEIKTVLKTDKTYVFKTAKTELKIDTEIIDFETLEKFTAELKKLDIEWY